MPAITEKQRLSLRRHFAFSGQFDKDTGVIEGVAICTIGEAKGHGLFVDLKFLEQLKACAEARRNKRVRNNADHWSGIKDVSGYFTNHVIDGNTLRADWHIFEYAEGRDLFFEMVKEIPDEFGISVSFEGEAEEIGRVYYARCENLISEDVVTQPAANPGLFDQSGKPVVAPADGVDREPNVTEPNKMTADELKAAVADAIKPHTDKMNTNHAELKGQYDGLCTRMSALETHVGMKDGGKGGAPGDGKEKPGEGGDGKEKPEGDGGADEPMAAIAKLRENFEKGEKDRKAAFEREVNALQEKVMGTLGKGRIPSAATPVFTSPTPADPTKTPAPAGVTKPGEQAKPTFEDKFQEKLDAGVSRTEAMGVAMEENPELHADYIKRFNTVTGGVRQAKPLSAYKPKTKTA
jgi:hypothetical protein